MATVRKVGEGSDSAGRVSAKEKSGRPIDPAETSHERPFLRVIRVPEGCR